MLVAGVASHTRDCSLGRSHVLLMEPDEAGMDFASAFSSLRQAHTPIRFQCSAQQDAAADAGALGGPLVSP